MKFDMKYSPIVCVLMMTCLIEKCSGQFNNNAFNIGVVKSILSNRTTKDPSWLHKSELYLETDDKIKKHGYPSESHVIRTDDGYMLTVHRIPRGIGSNDTRVRAPVLLMHGLLSASDQWTLTGPEKGLAFILADAGYDVWLGNARGNYYSRSHVTMSPRQSAFWNFTWHEMGNNDLPAVIDHILDTTNESQLFYIGHSMGCAMYFALVTTQPEYNQKIRLMVALAPGVYIKKQQNLLGETLLRFNHHIGNGIFRSKNYELFPRNPRRGYIAQALCGDGQIFHAICAGLYYSFFGNTYNRQLNHTLLPALVSHLPAGASAATLDHFLGVFKSDRFQWYDRSRTNKTMTKYDLSQASAPVVICYSPNDAIVHHEGVVRLSKELPNVVGMLKAADKYKLNHMDFVTGVDAKKLVFDDMLSLMMKY